MNNIQHIVYTIIGLMMILGNVAAQVTNSECYTPIQISDPVDYCSGATEFTNVGAGSSQYDAPNCFSDDNNDVWFRFTSIGQEVSVVVTGTAGSGTLAQPEVALYIDNGCSGVINELRCESDANATGIVSLIRGGLTIGESYYIRIDGRANSQGTFQLCVKNYNPPVEAGQDCPTGAVLCDKTSFIVPQVTGAGNDNDEASGTCLGTFGVSEQRSTWFRWTCKESGTLTFVLDPLREYDDLDFVLFELPNGVDDCSGKFSVRCNATFGTEPACGDQTGLDLESTELEENSNCDPGEDGFVKYIDMVAGKSYALLVNNFTTSDQGFEITFGGTGTFLGPEPEFIVTPLEGLRCDSTFTVVDASTFDNGIITDWAWNFGKGAVPQTSDQVGPHAIDYESFGQKTIALTVTSDKGCVVTKLLDLDVLACCKDTSTLEALAMAQDALCADSNDGVITTGGNSGAMPYQYSVNGSTFTPQSLYPNLPAGEYEVQIQDSKGCMDTIMTTIAAPPQIIVDAGEDQEVELGDRVQIMATYTPVNQGDVIQWVVADGLSCDDCLDPSTLPPGTTEYVLQVQDANGCLSYDTIVIRTLIDIERPIFEPNVMLLENSQNGKFMVGTGKAVDRIDEITIYDRWGSLIWRGTNIEPNDFQSGWDGMFDGTPVEAGVYVWVAKVHYLDNEVYTYHGDVTVLR